MPDEYGFGKYEAFAADLDEATANDWLENFSRALVSDLDTFNAVFMITPVGIGAKATVIDNTGKTHGTYEADETTGIITVRGLENGKYTAVINSNNENFTAHADYFTINNGDFEVAFELGEMNN